MLGASWRMPHGVTAVWEASFIAILIIIEALVFNFSLASFWEKLPARGRCPGGGPGRLEVTFGRFFRRYSREPKNNQILWIVLYFGCLVL